MDKILKSCFDKTKEEMKDKIGNYMEFNNLGITKNELDTTIRILKSKINEKDKNIDALLNLNETLSNIIEKNDMKIIHKDMLNEGENIE